MIKIEGDLAGVLLGKLIYEIEKNTNDEFSNMILKNEPLMIDMGNIFVKALQQCAKKLNQEKIGKPHKENAKG